MNNSNRVIYRHENNLGSVIEFKMFGNPVKLFIPDAQYRPREIVKWGEKGTKPLIKQCEGFYPHDVGFNSSKELDFTIPDSKLDSKFTWWRSDGSARDNTDSMIFADADAGKAVRSVQINGLGAMDLPNLYELYVIWLEADRLDLLDPTAFASRQNLSCLLGSKQGNRFRNYCFWSSTERSPNFSWCISNNGYVDYYDKSVELCVLPVLEL